MRTLITLIFSIFFVLFNCTYSFAFFTENYRNNVSYGVFKKVNNSDLYFSANVGFVPKIWTPNILTSVSSNQDSIPTYLSSMSQQITLKTNDYYTYYIGIALGLNIHKSILRHELEFNWYGLASKSIDVGETNISVNGSNLTYLSVDGKMVESIGVYANIYKLTYNVYLNFDKVFKFMGQQWDIYLGAGAGFAFVNSGTYIARYIDNGNLADNGIGEATKAQKNALHNGTSFAVGYQAKVGMIANMSQAFTVGLSAKFGATSRPLFTTKFKYIEKVDGINSHLEYHIGIEISILIKAMSIAI